MKAVLTFIRGFWSSSLSPPLILALLWTMTGCLNQIDSGGRPLIRDYSLHGSSDSNICKDYLNEDATLCHDSCPENTHEALGAEKEAVYKRLKETLDGLSTKEREYKAKNLEEALGICLPGAEISRPNREVYIQKDFCSCLKGKKDMINDCSVFCLSKDVEEPTLYVSTKLGPNILLNSLLGNLYNWCHEEIDDGHSSPSCELKAWDGENTLTLPVTLSENQNSFTSNISGLRKNKTYVVNLVEKTSGSSSTSFQIRRINPPVPPPIVLGPLQMAPVSQYSCITRSGSITEDGEYYVNAVRVHYYFPSVNAPNPLPPGNNFLICHDTQTYGNNDSSAYPRLEQISQHLTLWSYNDIRFFDQDNNQKLDINDTLEKRLKEEFDVTAEVNLFGPLSWPNRPSLDSDVVPKLGIVMQPWIDSSTGRTFCPHRDDYQNGDPLLSLLYEIVGVDTEAIYMAEREPQSLLNIEGKYVGAPSDVQLIREGLLKKIWFYFQNGTPVKPDHLTATQRTLMYYWPSDINYPFTKKANQSIYIVRSPSSIGKDMSLSTGLSPADKRFGCIPLLQQD